MRRLAGWIHLLLISALITSGCARLNPFNRSESPMPLAKGPRVGTIAPEIDGVDFEGQPFKLSDYRGKVVVVSFWASWCSPCRDLIPHEKALANQFRNRNFVLLGVNIDNNPEDALKVMARYGVTWRNWRGGGDANPIQQHWPVEAIPTVYVIDPHGIVRHAGNSGHNLENIINALLKDAEAQP
jgi:thiol-disulfide isomerase/thioredoxin